VLIVENKVNLLTLPMLPETIGLGGLGNAVTDLRYLSWLNDKEVWYWGDIDVDGFEILSRLRAFLPRTRTLMMDSQTVETWREFIGTTGNHRQGLPPAGLTSEESMVHQFCATENLRIEQERIPQTYVEQQINSIFPKVAKEFSSDRLLKMMLGAAFHDL
jgi:hypothetical protein